MSAAPSHAFLRIRAMAFSLIMFTCFVWISLLCTYAFLEWDNTDSAERPIIALMLLIDSLTIVVLLVLLILPFRAWLDGARFLFLLLAHIGVAGAFALWNPRFKCPTFTADAEGVCQLLNLYILLSSWVIPILLVTYVSGLAYAMRRRSPPNSNPPPEVGRESILPMMRPATSRSVSYSSSSEKTLDRGSAEDQRKHISGLSSGLTKMPAAYLV